MVLPLLFKEQIDEADLLGLKGIPSETEWFDIKSRSYTVKPDEIWKQELCEDISAFANAQGGLIFLGVNEDANGRIGDPCGLGANFDVDAEIRRLRQAAESGIAPLVPRVRFHPVSLFNGTDVAIAIQIPRSFAAPHKVIRLPQGASQSYQIFKIRRSNGNADMSLDELRMEFSLAESYIERVRNFHKRRIDVISEAIDDEPVPASLESGVKLVLHVLPLTLSDPTSKVDLNILRNSAFADPWFSSRLPHSRFNLEGLLLPGGLPDSPILSYTQIFRSGAIEMVEVVRPRVVQETSFVLLSQVEIWGIQGFQRCLEICRRLTAPLPIAVMMSIVEVQGIRFVESEREFNFNQLPTFPSPPIRHSNLVIPEILYEDYDHDYRKAMQPLFDILWNAGGWAGSENYDENGEWISPSQRRW